MPLSLLPLFAISSSVDVLTPIAFCLYNASIALTTLHNIKECRRLDSWHCMLPSCLYRSHQFLPYQGVQVYRFPSLCASIMPLSCLSPSPISRSADIMIPAIPYLHHSYHPHNMKECSRTDFCGHTDPWLRRSYYRLGAPWRLHISLRVCGHSRFWGEENAVGYLWKWPTFSWFWYSHADVTLQV